MSDEIILDEIRLKEQKKAERRARKEARAAEWQAIKDGWQPKVEKHFSYLQEQYGFRLTQFDTSKWWFLRVIYQTKSTAIYVDRNKDWQEVFVTLVPLTDGVIPPDDEEKSDGFLLGNLLELRAPQLLPILSVISGLKDEHVEASLAFHAHTLREYADDILCGNFAVIRALEEFYNRKRSEALQHGLHYDIMSRTVR